MMRHPKRTRCRIILSILVSRIIHARLQQSNYNVCNAAQERMRKEYLRNLFDRTPEQIAEEEALYVEVKRLEADERRWAKDRDDLLRTQAGVESGLPNLNTHWDVISGVNVSAGDRKSLKKRDGADTSFLGVGAASFMPKRDKAYGQSPPRCSLSHFRLMIPRFTRHYSLHYEDRHNAGHYHQI